MRKAQKVVNEVFGVVDGRDVADGHHVTAVLALEVLIAFQPVLRRRNVARTGIVAQLAALARARHRTDTAAVGRRRGRHLR